MPTVEQWREPLSHAWEPPDLEQKKVVEKMRKYATIDDAYLEDGQENGSFLVSVCGPDGELRLGCFLCMSLKKYYPREIHHHNTFCDGDKKVPSQAPRTLKHHHIEAKDHKVAFGLYTNSVQQERLRDFDSGDVVPEGKVCLEMLRREHRQVAARWAAHAWIALRHYDRHFLAGWRRCALLFRSAAELAPADCSPNLLCILQISSPKQQMVERFS